MNKNLVFVAVGLLMSGCALEPKYERPQVNVPEEYKRTNASSETEKVEIKNWQDYFKDEQLINLIEIALKNNKDIQISALNIERTQAQFSIQSSQLLPNLVGSVSHSYTENINNDPPVPDHVKNYSVGLAIPSWEIDLFGRIKSLKKQALSTYLASVEVQRNAELSLISGVAQSWFSLKTNLIVEKYLKNVVASLEESESLTKLRLKHGLISELDLQRFQMNLETAKANLINQEKQIDLDKNALVLLIGQALPEDLNFDSEILLELEDIPAGLPSELLTKRPDILQAEQLLIGANANIGAARANFFPSISLTSSLGTQSQELDNLFDTGAFNFSPSIRLPIFTAGINQTNLKISKINREIAIKQYEKTIQTAFKEVSDYLDSHSKLLELLKTRENQLNLINNQLKLTELSYKQGIISNIELLELKRNVINLEQAVAQTKLLSAVNKINLYKSLGGAL